MNKCIKNLSSISVFFDNWIDRFYAVFFLLVHISRAVTDKGVVLVSIALGKVGTVKAKVQYFY